MATDINILSSVEEKMKKTIQSVQTEFVSLRTGRANPALLDRIIVDYWGTPTQLKQLAAIGVPDSRTLNIQPFDRTSMEAIEKAILKSDLGLTPTNDGVILRLHLPALTEERRKELVKVVKKIGEEGKVGLRNERRDGVDKIKKQEKDGAVSKDESKKLQDQLQKMTDKYVVEIDKLISAKETEIMER